MTISSKKGTGKDIEVFDYFDDNIVGSQTKQVILLDRIYIWDNNGSYVENIQIEQYENCGFVTTLPKLEAGQKYTITCVALVNKQLLSTSATTNLKLNKNIFYVRSGKNEHSSYAEAEYRRNVIKKTSEKQEDGSYKYTVTINESQENLKGLTIKDTFKLDDTVIDINDIEGFYVDVQGGSNPGITKENFFSTGYKFENDFNNKIVITYRYYPSANETNAEKKLVNRIEIGPNTWGEVEDTIGIIGYLDKTHDENQVVKKDGYVEVPYLVTVTVNDGIAEGATLTDTLNQDRIQSLLTPVTVNGIEASDYTIQYLGKDGVLVNEFAEGMIGFKVTFKAITPEKAQKINFEYKVKAEFASYPAGTFRYDNVAVFASGSINQTKTDSYTYTKHAFLLKKVSRYSSGYQTSIGEVKESDLTDGKLYYELEIKPAERNLNDTFTVTDTLPEGAVYVEDSFNASPTTLNQMSVSEDGRTLTFTIPKEVYVNEDGSYKHDVLYIHYAVQISNANLSGSQQELVYFTNTATSGEDTASVTVPVLFEKKEIEKDDVIDKKGFQNNSDITYTIVVNKNRLDLIPNVDKITLNDVLKCDVDESKIQDITLVGNIVSVYEYDASKPDGKGAPVSKNFYTYQYNEKTHNISMVLPDSAAFVVEYTYRFKFTSNYAGQTITIKNNVELVGSYKKEISTQWKNQSAGGSVAKYNSLIVYKVEKGNEDEKLSGAKFNLYKYNDGSFSLIQNDIEIPVTGCKFVSDKTDEDMMAATDIAVDENVLYYLEEIQAPSGYKIEAGHEKFYFALGTYGKSIKDLKAAVAKAVKAAKITVDDVHFANTNAIVNIENEIEDGAVRIQKVWLNHDGSEMQASESSISVGLYKTHHRYTDAQPVEVEVSYKGNGMSSPQLAFASTEYYRIGTKLTVTGYLNEGWRKNWGGWDFASTQMTARLYINGNDCGELNIENVYSVTHSEIVSSTLNKISIVVTANTYNSILDGNKPGKVNGTIATLAAGDMEFVQNVTIDSHNNWTAVVSGLPTKENDGEDIYYYVTEFSLYGYTISYQNNGVLAGVGGNPIVVINKADEKVKTASFSINKVDASTSTPQPLEGASFALYRAVKNDQNQFIRVGLPIATAISNASGTGVVFSGLIPGEYLLYETSAPTGYVTPSEPWRITVNNDCVVDAHGLQANSDGAYIIENGKYPGILSITKKVEGYEMEGGMHYYIKVTLTDAADKPLTGSFNGIRLENGSAIYELVKDATITFTGLPLGTKYTVEEVNFDGTALTGEEEYTSSLSTNATGTIDKEAGTVAVNVTVTNIYEIPETSAVISVKKIVDGTGYNQNEAFEFTLSAAEEGTPMPTETGNKVSIKAGEIGSFGSITYTDTGVYYYTVKETKGSTVGMSYDETEYLVTVVVSMNDERKLTASVYYNIVMTDIPEVESDVRALVVTNTYRVTSVSGTKTWRAPEGTDLPESITVILKRNGSPVDSKKVTAADDWSYEFTELPAYSEDGLTAYTYTVEEKPVEGYITTVSGTNLINTITGTTSVSGTKTWRVPEGTELPESITVILNRNDEPVARKKVTAADDWSYEFTELPAYSEDGSTAYTYTVDEEPVEGYITTVSETNLINTITSVKISKVDIADGEELEGATIQLIDKETGEVVEEWTSTNEAHEVTGLTTGKTYILRETVAPEGYGITSDTTFELKEDGSIDTEKTTTTVSEEGVLLVEDTRRIDFIVNKVSATDDHELYDTILSVYEITDEGEVLVDSWTSRWKEVHNFGLKLSCGKSYILREDKATGGYHKIPGDILFNVTADGKIQITEGQDWKYENGKNVIEEVVDEAGNVIYLIRDVRNPEEEEETEPDGPTDPHQSETTTPEETTTSEEETTPEETTTSEEETSPEETTVSEEETTVSEEETTLPSPDDEESTPEVTTPAANTTTTAAETTVSETPTTTPSSERVILGIEDMSRTIGMALAGFGAIMLTALIWLYLRSKKA
ncbi:MAG: Cna B-type domain-containing protein [Lachnospiraceae bacterium]